MFQQQHPPLSGPPAAGSTPFEILRVDADRTDEAARIVLSGELDVAGREKVRRELERFAGSGIERLVLDLSGLEFMDSTGIRLLLEARDLAERDGVAFAIVQGPPKVRRVLELVGLDDRLPLVDAADDPVGLPAQPAA